MVWCINMTHNIQMTLRNILKDKEKNDMKIFSEEGLSCINDVKDIFDESISSGRNNWQVYASKKPKCDAYKIKYIFNITIDNDEYNFEMKDKSTFNIEEMLPVISAKNKNNIKILDSASLKPKYIQLAENFKKKKKSKDTKKKELY